MKINLRDVPTEQLERELKARTGCADCRTQFSRGWYDVPHHRQICFTCRAKRRLDERKRRKTVTPLLTGASV